LFNKNITISRKDFIDNYGLILSKLHLKLTKWITEEEMTGEEKKENPNFYITKGYLKTFTSKDAWKNLWETLTNEEKNGVCNLPNFDAVVFFDVTGIDVRVDTDKLKKELISHAEDLLRQGNELLKKAKGML